MHTYHNIIDKILNYYISNKIEEEWNKYYLCSLDNVYLDEITAIFKIEEGIDVHKKYYENKKNVLPSYGLENINDTHFKMEGIKNRIIDKQKFIPKSNVEISDKYISQCIKKDLDRYYYYSWVEGMFRDVGCGIINIKTSNLHKRLYEKDNHFRDIVDTYVKMHRDCGIDSSSEEMAKFIDPTFITLLKKIELSEKIE